MTAPTIAQHPRSLTHGQATVEFTLALLIFLPMIFGTIELGRAVWYYNQVSQLAREGARWAIVTSADGSTAYQATGNTPGTYQVAACSCTSNTVVGWIGRQDVGIPHNQLRVILQRQDPLPRFTWGVPVTVTVEYAYRPIAADLLKLPTTINLRSQTTIHMQ